MDSTVFSAEFDFYQDILCWATYEEELRDVLVDMAWDVFRYDVEPDEYAYYHLLAGDRFLTKIELDGPTVVVTIFDDDIGE